MIAKENLDYTFHDRQFVIDQVSQNTSSTSFVDVNNATITTKDLEDIGNYTINISLVIQASQANTLASFTILINGTPTAAMDRIILIKTNNFDIGVTFFGISTGLVAGDVLQIQWKTDKGTITLSEFNFTIDGIQEVKVI